MIDATHDASARSWVAAANGHPDFPLQNLPLGIFSFRGDARKRGGVAIGDEILDLAAVAKAGLLSGEARRAADAAGDETLNALMTLGAGPRRALRQGLFELLAASSRQRAEIEAKSGLLHRALDCTLHLPARIGDYTDFYAGIHHAHAVGKLFRPDNPLLPNYKHVPIAYHGRASSVVASGAAVRRPSGQRKLPSEDAPVFGPARNLDFELELGIWIGAGNGQGEPVPIGDASAQIAGFCLLNDWSARDIQAWEYQPLGPFLAKNFATTISPWVVTPEAMAPFSIAPTAAAAGRSGAAPLSRGRGRPGGRCVRSRARRVDPHPRAARQGSAGAAAHALQRAAYVLDGRADDCAPHLRRLQSAARRPLRIGDDLGADGRWPRQPA